MKTIKNLFICLFIITPLSSISQTKDSVSIVKLVDEMSDESYIVPSYKLVVANDDKTVGIIIDVFIKDDFTLNAVYVKSVGIGTCSENDEIIILFENGEKIKKTSNTKFNCEGKSYFFFNKDEINLLKTVPLDKIRITNGRSYESFTEKVSTNYKRWFIQLFYAMDNKLFQTLNQNENE